VNPVAELLIFGVVMALGQFSPGPDLILVTRTALAGGGRAGAWTAVGIACGLMVHATLAVGGTAALLGGGGWPGQLVRWLAFAYLGWLGWGLLRAAIAGKSVLGGAFGKKFGALQAFRRGLLCNLLNPKVALFLAAVAAPFLHSGRAWWWPAAAWLVIVCQGLALWIAWSWVLQWRPARRIYQRSARWIDGSFGLMLWLLALRLVLA
jgi:threonine/homoserine/homoserine lactone efflux protein